MERSYNAGEAHIYTHHLYKARGNAMYKSIKEGYASQRLIRGRVDAFIRMFERLLDTVSSAPNSDNMVDACLASESGKLYLLMAEATGRLQ